MTGDYHEGLEEGIKIGRREALAAAVRAAKRPAGNRLLDFQDRQAIIVRRVRDCLAAPGCTCAISPNTGKRYYDDQCPVHKPTDL